MKSAIAVLLLAAGILTAQNRVFPNPFGPGSGLEWFPTTSAPGAITAVNTSITANSLGAQAICALHTDTGCFNTTDATAANCPAGTLSAPCTFPTSITIPANTLGSNIATVMFAVGTLATATIPTAIFEVYLDSTRIYAGTAAAFAAGSGSLQVTCHLTALTSTNSAPVSIGCMNNGTMGQTAAFARNTLDTNTTPGIAIDTTVGHVLKLSLAYTSATTGNLTWLYGIKLSQSGTATPGTVTSITQGCGLQFSTTPLVSTGTVSATGPCWAAGGGTAQAQTATFSPAVALADGLEVCWKPTAANTGAGPTFAPNGLTAHTIVRAGGALVQNDIITTAQACAVYNTTGTQWELQNPQAVAGIITAVNPSILTNSLGAQAVCSLHTDTGCFNTVTDATTANCPAGRLSAPCTFPTSITIPAHALDSNTASFSVNLGSIATATVPASLIEIYLGSTRVYAGTSAASAAGNVRSTSFFCLMSGLSTGATNPIAVSCSSNGTLAGNAASFSSNPTLTNTTPAVAFDSTVSNLLKVSVAYASAVTGNLTWLYGMRFVQ